MSNRYTVIAAVAGKENTTFYTKDGKTVSVNANDPRLPKLLAQCNPYFARKQPVEIDLGSYSMYAEFEEKTNGLVRFFRAAKKKVQSVFESLVGPDPDDSTVEEDNKALQAKMDAETEIAVETVVTEVMVDPTLGQDLPKVPEPPKQKIRYDEVKDDLKPVKENEPLKEDETLVAVIGKVVIPNIQQLKPYIAHALKHNSEKAVVAFLERISMVIDQRGHSIPDLFNFLERGDLPLAEDGSIIAYKILRKTNAHPGFTYVDCHSQKVHQRVGTFVRVEEKLVDKNRSNECSNGLHVARRGYIGNFSGDVCTMIKMAPEDVIAVPHGDFNKVRCMGYHIIFELPKHVYDVLRSNRPMTSDPEAAAMLEKAIKGDHIGVLEEVWIGGQRGSNLSVKNRVEGAIERVEKKKAVVKEGTEVSGNAAAFDDPVKSVLDVKKVQQEARAEEAKAAVEAKETLLQTYNRVLNTKDKFGAQAILDRKKKAKKSWHALGLPGVAEELLKAVVSGLAGEPEASPVVKAEEKPVKAKAEKAPKTKAVKAKPEQPKVEEPKKKAPKPVPEAVVKAATTPTKDNGAKKSTSEIAQDYYLSNKWADLWAFKKAKKKGWETFGFSAKEIAEIEKNKPA